MKNHKAPKYKGVSKHAQAKSAKDRRETRREGSRMSRPAYCRVNLTPARATRYGLSARQVRNACVLGCVAGLVAIPVLCWAVDRFTL